MQPVKEPARPDTIMSDSEANNSVSSSSDNNNNNNSSVALHVAVVFSLRALYVAVKDREPLEFFETILEAADPFEGMHKHEQWDLLHVIKSALDKNDLDPQIARLLVQTYPQVTRMRLGYRDGGLLLHAACKNNAPSDTIQLLLNLNPDSISQRDDSGWLPLHRACIYMEPSLTMIELLISHYPEAVRAPVNAIECGNELALHLALTSGASADIIFILLDHYPDAAKLVTEWTGEIALHYPYHDESTDTATLQVYKRLIKLYPEGVYHTTDNGSLPLHNLCQCPFIPLNVVKFLIDQYPDSVKTRNMNVCLPLHCAVYSGSLEIIQLLIEYYPDSVKSKDGHGKLVLHAACNDGASRNVVELLMDCYNGEESHHSGLSVVDNNGYIPLHDAAVGRVTVETMQLLLDRYPEGTSVASRDGRLPLHVASTCSVQRGIIQHIRLLVESNPFSVLKTTTDGRTALQLASEVDTVDHDIVAFLLETQNEAVRAIREAFDNVVDHQLGFPDLVVANIWRFVKPDLWKQGEEEELESDEEFEEQVGK